MIGDSDTDIGAAYGTNELSHKRGQKRKARPVLFEPCGRKVKIKKPAWQKYHEWVAYSVLPPGKARTLMEAVEMGYAESGEPSYLEKHRFSTSAALISVGIAAAHAGLYLSTGDNYWHILSPAYPLIVAAGIQSIRAEKMAGELREDSKSQ